MFNYNELGYLPWDLNNDKRDVRIAVSLSWWVEAKSSFVKRLRYE